MQQTQQPYQSKQWRRHLHHSIAEYVVLLLALLHLDPVSSSSAVTMSRDTNHHRPKIWGMIPKIETYFNVNRRNPPATATSTEDFPRHLIIMGGPASGKGTQCQAIAEKHGLVHLSTGDMLRQALSSESVNSEMAPHITTIKKYMESGRLIPDDIIVRLVLERLQSPDCRERGWILDGFPRTANQAKALKRAGIDPDIFLLLNVPDDEAIKRACGRRTDPVTGKTYHLDFNPPPNNEVRQRLIVRSDDTVESMKQRLKQFHDNANAVKGCYKNFVEVDGLGRPDEVLGGILSSITQLNQRKQLKMMKQ